MRSSGDIATDRDQLDTVYTYPKHKHRVWQSGDGFFCHKRPGNPRLPRSFQTLPDGLRLVILSSGSLIQGMGSVGILRSRSDGPAKGIPPGILQAGCSISLNTGLHPGFRKTDHSFDLQTKGRPSKRWTATKNSPRDIGRIRTRVRG